MKRYLLVDNLPVITYLWQIDVSPSRRSQEAVVMTSQKQKVYLVPAGKPATARFFKTTSSSEIQSWVYLGKNVARSVEIEELLHTSAQKIRIGEELQNTAKAHKQDYIDFIGSIATTERLPFWYLTSVSEKSSFISDLYLHFCYARTLITLLKNQHGTVCVFCENGALIRTLQKNLVEYPGFEVIVHANLTDPAKKKVCRLTVLAGNKVWFMFRYLARIFCAKLIRIFSGKRQDRGNHPKNVIHSWADQRSFTHPGIYNDVYFGMLGSILEKHDLETSYLVNILPTEWYPGAAKRLASTGAPWILFEEFLGYSDVFHAIAEVNRQRRWISRSFVLDGMDITDLVLDERERDYTDSRAEQAYLYYCAGRRMAQSLSLKTFLYSFENHIWEKMFIEGIHSISRTPVIIGYAHSIVNAMELSYSISAVEKRLVPLPDRIFVNGVRAEQVLAESGFDDVPIHVTGALRYGRNVAGGSRGSSPVHTGRILVVLSGDFDRAVEMILKSIAAFASERDLAITIKPHPVLKISEFHCYTKDLPENFSFSYEPIQELFKRTDLVIYNDSAASVEAAAIGLPLLHMKSDLSIDLNIFEGTALVPSSDLPQSILSLARNLLSDNSRFSSEAESLAVELFAPVNEQRIVSIITEGKDL